MKKIILTKTKKDFSYIKYFMFVYMKKYNLYDKYIHNDIFYIPYKKRLKIRYLDTICDFLKRKNIDSFLAFDEEIKKHFKKHFSAIIGKNIYSTLFCDILDFLSKNKLYEYELVFISDNLKETKKLAEKSVKKVKSISVLTQNPYLYESMKDYLYSKYGITLNIKTKKEKFKKHNKIYINCGANRVFEKSAFTNVNILDIYNVYDGAYSTIILESSEHEKKYTNTLKCPYSLGLAEFLYSEKDNKKYKIVNIKK